MRTAVELIRDTPFLVQLFLISFGLPAAGLRVGAVAAALTGTTLNLAASSTEIIRSGIEAVHKSQVEAGKALGFTQFQVHRHVIILPAIRKLFPALCSRYLLMMLASSICSAISTGELTAAASFFQSQSYRSFEVYIAVALALRGLVALLGLWLFGRRGPAGAGAGRGGFGVIFQTSGWPQLCFLVQSLQWTVILTALALGGGGFIGFGVALGRVRRWQRDVSPEQHGVLLLERTPHLVRRVAPGSQHAGRSER